MKRFIIIAAIACVVVACDNNKAQKEKEAANLELIRTYLDAVEQKDYTKMSSLLADNYLGLGPSIYDSTNKSQAVEAWKFNSANVYESIDFNMLQLLPASLEEGPSAGDWVLAWANLELWFVDADAPVNLWINTVYRIENGKIVRSRSFFNEADVMKQLGLPTFPPLFLEEGTELEIEDDMEETEGEDS